MHSIAIGESAGTDLTTGGNNIEIGNAGVVGESNTIRIGSGQTATFSRAASGGYKASYLTIPFKTW